MSNLCASFVDFDDSVILVVAVVAVDFDSSSNRGHCSHDNSITIRHLRLFGDSRISIMDSEYLKMHVGDALTRGLAEVVKIRPSNPIEYLAFWLQKYVENRDHAKQVWPNYHLLVNLELLQLIFIRIRTKS